MSGFFKCVIFLAVSGIFSFLLGRILPPSWFHYDRFPYRSFAFEQNGKIYTAIKISRWKEPLPDMSRIFPKLMPSKGLARSMSAAQTEQMLTETCIAEFIHTLLCITGLALIPLWDGIGGWICYIIYVLGNIPFNLIQRYNRPKLVRILERLNTKEQATMQRLKREDTNEKNLSVEL